MDKTRIIAITGGKGGVGKSSIALNLATALHKEGKSVCLFDADFELANLHIMLKLKPKKTILDVLENNCKLKDVVIETKYGFKFIPSFSGDTKLANLNYIQLRNVLDNFEEIKEDFDYLIIDTAAGVSRNVLGVLQFCDDIMVVVNSDPTSITDAYALIKLMNRNFKRDRFNVITNKTRTVKDATDTFNQLIKVCDMFLDVVLQYSTDIPFDRNLEKATRHGEPVSNRYLGATGTRIFKELAVKLHNIYKLKEAKPKENICFPIKDTVSYARK